MSHYTDDVDEVIAAHMNARTRSATLTVAANDASTYSKEAADYVCDGTEDDVPIQAAIDALP